MSVELLRVVDPNMLYVPMVDGILTEASAHCKVWPNQYPGIRQEMKQVVFDTAHNLVNIGIEDGSVHGVSVTMLPSDNLFMPQQFMYYCTGSIELQRAMIQACVDFVKAAGYNKGWTVNGTGIDDALWLRAHGLKGKVLGSLIEFSL